MTILTRTLGLGGQDRAGGVKRVTGEKAKKIQKAQFWDTRALYQSFTSYRIFFFLDKKG